MSDIDDLREAERKCRLTSKCMGAQSTLVGWISGQIRQIQTEVEAVEDSGAKTHAKSSTGNKKRQTSPNADNTQVERNVKHRKSPELEAPTTDIEDTKPKAKLRGKRTSKQDDPAASPPRRSPRIALQAEQAASKERNTMTQITPTVTKKVKASKLIRAGPRSEPAQEKPTRPKTRRPATVH